MTHPHPGHGANPFETGLRQRRSRLVDEAPLPPRRPGFTASLADHVTRTASKPGEHYEQYLRDPNDGYLRYAAEFVYDKRGEDGTHTDNAGIVGDLMEEFHQKYNREFDGEFDDEDKSLADGRYSKYYKDTKWTRRLKKLGAKAATGAASVTTGAALYTVGPGALVATAAVAGTTAAAYGSKVYIPSPKEHREIIEQVFKGDKISEMQASIARQLERLGFGDNDAQLTDVRRGVNLQASKIKISAKDKLSRPRKAYLEEKRKILRDLHRELTEPDFDENELEWRRVETAAKLTWLDLQRATNEAMKKRQKIRARGRAVAWVAGVTIGATAAFVVHANNEQEQTRLEQIDPIHHGDTSNEVNGDNVDSFLPGPNGPSITITAPPTR